MEFSVSIMVADELLDEAAHDSLKTTTHRFFCICFELSGWKQASSISLRGKQNNINTNWMVEWEKSERAPTKIEQFIGFWMFVDRIEAYIYLSIYLNYESLVFFFLSVLLLLSLPLLLFCYWLRSSVENEKTARCDPVKMLLLHEHSAFCVWYLVCLKWLENWKVRWRGTTWALWNKFYLSIDPATVKTNKDIFPISIFRNGIFALTQQQQHIAYTRMHADCLYSLFLFQPSNRYPAPETGLYIIEHLGIELFVTKVPVFGHF